MYIIFGMTPATSTTSAMPETVTTFDRNIDAHNFIKMYNPLPQEEKDKLKGKQISIENVMLDGKQQTKTVTIRNKYTIMYIEEL